MLKTVNIFLFKCRSLSYIFNVYFYHSHLFIEYLEKTLLMYTQLSIYASGDETTVSFSLFFWLGGGMSFQNKNKHDLMFQILKDPLIVLRGNMKLFCRFLNQGHQ